MSARRPLGETLAEVAAGTVGAVAATAGFLTPREVRVVLPLEIALRRTPQGLSLAGDLPRTVTRTDFDLEPSRLELVCRAEGAA
jgi:hypothetical protein